MFFAGFGILNVVIRHKSSFFVIFVDNSTSVSGAKSISNNRIPFSSVGQSGKAVLKCETMRCFRTCFGPARTRSFWRATSCSSLIVILLIVIAVKLPESVDPVSDISGATGSVIGWSSWSSNPELEFLLKTAAK